MLTHADTGGRGVEKGQICADVICERSPSIFYHFAILAINFLTIFAIMAKMVQMAKNHLLYTSMLLYMHKQLSRVGTQPSNQRLRITSIDKSQDQIKFCHGTTICAWTAVQQVLLKVLQSSCPEIYCLLIYCVTPNTVVYIKCFPICHASQCTFIVFPIPSTSTVVGYQGKS